MHNIELSTPPRHPRAKRRLLAVVGPLVGLLLIAGCGDVAPPADPVESRLEELRNNGRTPQQVKCDNAWQGCYVDCSVRYPEEGLGSDLREGCFDACDAAYNLCLVYGRIGGGPAVDVAAQGSVVSARATVGN